MIEFRIRLVTGFKTSRRLTKLGYCRRAGIKFAQAKSLRF
jgi:hypothetical protein